MRNTKNITAINLGRQDLLCHGQAEVTHATLKQGRDSDENTMSIMFDHSFHDANPCIGSYWHAYESFWYFLTEIFVIPTGKDSFTCMIMNEHLSKLAHLTDGGVNYITDKLGAKEAQYFAIARNMWLVFRCRMIGNQITFIAENSKQATSYCRDFNKIRSMLPESIRAHVGKPSATCGKIDPMAANNVGRGLTGSNLTFNINGEERRNFGVIYSNLKCAGIHSTAIARQARTLSSMVFHLDGRNISDLPQWLQDSGMFMPWSEDIRQKDTASLYHNIGCSDLFVLV